MFCYRGLIEANKEYNPKIFNLYSSVKFIAYPVYNSNSRTYKGSQFKQIILHLSSNTFLLIHSITYATWYNTRVKRENKVLNVNIVVEYTCSRRSTCYACMHDKTCKWDKNVKKKNYGVPISYVTKNYNTYI